jgi:hypothetical protein
MLEPAGTAKMGGQRAESSRTEGRTRIAARERARAMPVERGGGWCKERLKERKGRVEKLKEGRLERSGEVSECQPGTLRRRQSGTIRQKMINDQHQSGRLFRSSYNVRKYTNSQGVLTFKFEELKFQSY